MPNNTQAGIPLNSSVGWWRIIKQLIKSKHPHHSKVQRNCWFVTPRYMLVTVAYEVFVLNIHVVYAIQGVSVRELRSVAEAEAVRVSL